MISIICAVSLNGVIGVRGNLPWRLPKDLKRFKEKTLGNTVIMGSNTLRSIGGPLPGRRNVIITRNRDTIRRLIDDSIQTYESVHNAIESETGDIFITGGSRIFFDAMSRADRLLITIVGETTHGDTLFVPGYDFLMDDIMIETEGKDGAIDKNAFSRSERSEWVEDNRSIVQFVDFDRTEFNNEYLQQFSQSDGTLFALAKEYNDRTDFYDSTVCTGKSEKYGLMPANNTELALVNRNALMVFREISEKATGLGFTTKDLRNAISKAER